MNSSTLVIIGGGVAGTSLAYYAAGFGARVTVLERGQLNREASGSNAGSLHFQLRGHDAISDIRMELVRRSQPAWRQLSAELDAELEIRFHGGVMVAETASERERLDAKLEAERAMGLTTRVLSDAEARTEFSWLSPELTVAYCPEEGSTNPLLVTAAYAARAVERGVQILQNSPVLDISARASGGYSVDTESKSFDADVVVNAAGSWAEELSSMLGAQTPITALLQMVSVTERFPPIIAAMAQHIGRRLTLKQTRAGTVLIGGGWPGMQSDPGLRRIDWKNFADNLSVATAIVPALVNARLLRAWTGQIATFDDGLPSIGEHPGLPGFVDYVVPRGYAGYTFAPVLSEQLARVLCGKASDIDLKSYSPARFSYSEKLK